MASLKPLGPEALAPTTTDSKVGPPDQPAKEESPPPAYTTDQAPDITAAFAHLQLSGSSSSSPTADQCLAHLKLLEALQQLREGASFSSYLFYATDEYLERRFRSSDLDEMKRKVKEKRWNIYVFQAVRRFEQWWRICVEPNAQRLTNARYTQESSKEPTQGSALTFTKDNLPPIDVLMVWHAYQLNPRNYLEDCFRYGKMQFWRAGFPWAAVNECIDNETFEYQASEAAVSNFVSSTGLDWENVDNKKSEDDATTIACPRCQTSVRVPWTALLAKGSTDDGLTDRSMLATCHKCQADFRHDDLKVVKFRQDLNDLLKKDVPMPGTVIGIDGKIEPPKTLSRHPPMFPNRLLKAGDVPMKVLAQTAPGPKPLSVERIRQVLEQHLQNRRYRRAANDSSSSLQREERVAIRRMMSRYWDNWSPFSLDLVGAVIRQGSFIEKMHEIDWIHSPAAQSTMSRLLKKYTRYIEIIASNPKHVAVPTLDVDLGWHTQQLSPPSYYAYTVSKTDKFIDHDDKIDELKLSDAFEWTTKTYQKLYGEPYSDCTCWYCEAIRAAPASTLSSRLFGSNNDKSDTINAQLPHNTSTSTSTGASGPHISAHNAIRPSNDARATQRRSIAERTLHAKLQSNYQRAANRARKTGRPMSASPYPYAYAYAYTPMIMMPYGVDPYISCDAYAANPACATFAAGAPGNCCQGACGGGVAAGSCAGAAGAAGSCAGGVAGGCGGGGGGGGCGGGGGGGC